MVKPNCWPGVSATRDQKQGGESLILSTRIAWIPDPNKVCPFGAADRSAQTPLPAHKDVVTKWMEKVRLTCLVITKKGMMENGSSVNVNAREEYPYASSYEVFLNMNYAEARVISASDNRIRSVILGHVSWLRNERCGPFLVRPVIGECRFPNFNFILHKRENIEGTT